MIVKNRMPYGKTAVSSRYVSPQTFRIPHSAFRISPQRGICLFLTLSIFFLGACTHSSGKGANQAQPAQAMTGPVEIQQSWHGDYPVDGLASLPEDTHQPGTGYIADPKSFAAVWSAFKPTEPEPVIDFDENLVIFVRNIQYFNRIVIGKINLKNGVAEVLAMETLSARPIEDSVALSMVMVSREGVEGIQTRNGVIAVEGVR